MSDRAVYRDRRRWSRAFTTSSCCNLSWSLSNLRYTTLVNSFTGCATEAVYKRSNNTVSVKSPSGLAIYLRKVWRAFGVFSGYPCSQPLWKWSGFDFVFFWLTPHTLNSMHTCCKPTFSILIETSNELRVIHWCLIFAACSRLGIRHRA